MVGVQQGVHLLHFGAVNVPELLFVVQRLEIAFLFRRVIVFRFVQRLLIIGKRRVHGSDPFLLGLCPLLLFFRVLDGDAVHQRAMQARRRLGDDGYAVAGFHPVADISDLFADVFRRAHGKISEACEKQEQDAEGESQFF